LLVVASGTTCGGGPTDVDLDIDKPLKPASLVKQEKGWIEKLVAAGKKGADKVEDKAEDIVGKKKLLFLEQAEGTGRRGNGNGNGKRGNGHGEQEKDGQGNREEQRRRRRRGSSGLRDRRSMLNALLLELEQSESRSRHQAPRSEQAMQEAVVQAATSLANAHCGHHGCVGQEGTVKVVGGCVLFGAVVDLLV